jgi:LuxR family maltose regulon positive regulatory protein
MIMSRTSAGTAALARAWCEYHGDNLLAASAAAADARTGLRPGPLADVALPLVRARLKRSIGDESAAVRLTARAAARASYAPELFALTEEALGLTPLRDAVAYDIQLDDPRVSHPYAIARRALASAVDAFDAGQTDRAWQQLEQMLVLAERHGFRRLVLDAGIDVRPVLQQYLMRARPYTQSAWQLLQRLPAPRTSDAPPAVESLTERELAVLRQLPTMKSNQEIAAEMYFSVNTIKTHLKSIYRKLGVNRRRDAVEEARLRSLL